MENLKKMTPQEYTIPVGNECNYSSWLDVMNVCMKEHIHFENIKLILMKSAHSSMFLWLGSSENSSTAATFSVFKDDILPKEQKVEATIIYLKEGGYFRHKDDVYQVLFDQELGNVIRKVAIYASVQQADVAYRLSPSGQSDLSPEVSPKYYLVRLTEINKPDKTLCYSWYVEKKSRLFLQPIFCEDEEEFFKTNRCNLNWEFLHIGETFQHDGKTYQVCKDEDNNYFIAQIRSHLKVIICNP
ncbi:MAG: hypothetical protein IJ545_02760 [Alphaproteobacteria bacterium]|nr:hypothetical protein [Alphaproteobacteria bacterium]